MNSMPAEQTVNLPGFSIAATARGNKMNRTRIMKSAGLAGLVTSLCLALVGCPGGSSTPAVPPQANAAPGAIAVVGNESLADLGPVVPGSSHVVVFLVDNPSDRPLVFKTVRGDCECVSAKDAPDRIAAKGSAQIAVSYVAPKTAMDYESRLLIATDNPSRRIISLRVRSGPPNR